MASELEAMGTQERWGPEKQSAQSRVGRAEHEEEMTGSGNVLSPHSLKHFSLSTLWIHFCPSGTLFKGPYAHRPSYVGPSFARLMRPLVMNTCLFPPPEPTCLARDEHGHGFIGRSGLFGVVRCLDALAPSALERPALRL